MRAVRDNHDLEIGPPPPAATHDLGFLDSMDQLEDGLAPGSLDPDAAFWRVPSDPAKAFAPVDDLIVDRATRRRTPIESVALSVGFVLLVLAGAAASAFVFADRVGRLWV